MDLFACLQKCENVLALWWELEAELTAFHAERCFGRGEEAELVDALADDAW